MLVPISPYTKTFYIEWELNKTRKDYNVSLDQSLFGDLNIAKLNLAIQRLVNDVLVLHSHIETIDGECYWVRNVVEHAQLLDRGKFTHDKIFADIIEPFDLNTGPVFRFLLYRVSAKHHRLVMVFHHVIVDALSLDFMVNELSKYYNDEKYKFSISVHQQQDQLNILYKNLQTRIEMQKPLSIAFWKKKLQNLEAVPLDFLKNSYTTELKENSYINISKVNEINFNIDKNIIRKVSRDLDLTPYISSLAVFAILLFKYTGKKKFGISYPIAIREGVEFIYGSHVNTIVMPFDFTDMTSIYDIVTQVKNHIKSLKVNEIDHRNLPIYEFSSCFDLACLDLSFIQANFRITPLQFNGIKADTNSYTKLDISTDVIFEMEYLANSTNYKVRYDVDCIDEKLLNYFISQFIEIFNKLFKNNEPLSIAIADIDIIESKQKQILLNNKGKIVNSNNLQLSLADLFTAQVLETPDNIAIITNDSSISYAELYNLTNQICHYLKDCYNIQKGTHIGICLPREEILFPTILAILKLGGVYVPIDPELPKLRMEFILKNSDVEYLITKSIYLDKCQTLFKDNAKLINLNEEFLNNITHYSKEPLNVKVTGNDLAYIIYTSGSTGVPKGVMIYHKGIINLTNWYKREFQLNSNDRSGQFASFGFDVFICETMPFLLSGGAVVVINNAEKQNLNALFSVIERHRITILELPVSLGTLFLQEQFNSKFPLRLLKIGGEKVKKIGTTSYPFDIVNIYGPTEVSVDALSAKLYIAYPIPVHHFKHIKEPPIGKPIDNLTVYILNEQLDLLPIGALGEICLSGIGVGGGYFNNNELTSQSFTKNPYEPNKLLYKTGDLGRYLADGNIEFVGRCDEQVKIRGYRIELGDIETAICTYSGIRKSVCIVKDRGDYDKYIIAYYISNVEINHDMLLNYLHSFVPEYMLPTNLCRVDAIPVTVNGKIDKAKLLQLPESITKQIEYPVDDLESILIDLVSKLLKISSGVISRNDNLFRLGLNSILAIQFASKLQKELKLDVSVGGIFKAKTVSELAKQIYTTCKINEVIVTQPPNTKIPLSYSQERLWFIEQFQEETYAYNVPLLYRLKESANKEIIKETVNIIIQRHSILRTIIVESSDEIYQEVIESNLPVNEYSCKSNIELAELISAEFRTKFDLTTQIPIRASFYKWQDEEYLSLVIHHMSFDEWSIDIFNQEFIEIYTSLESSQEVHIDDLPIQYKDYAVWERNESNLAQELIDLEYWREKLYDLPTLNLFTDFPRAKHSNYIGDDYFFSLSEKLTNDIQSVAHNLGVTEYNILMAAFSLMLRVYTGQNDIVIGTSVSNRKHADVEKLIGFFVNAVVRRTTIDPEQKLSKFILQIAHDGTQAMLHKNCAYAKVSEKVNIDRNLIAKPLFNVLFGIQNDDVNKQVLSKWLEPISVVPKYFNVAKFDLSLFFDLSSKLFRGNFNYAKSLFNQDTIKNYADTYIKILKQLTYHLLNKNENKIALIKELTYLCKDEYKFIDGTQGDIKVFTNKKTIIDQFINTANKYKNSVAIKTGTNKLTYYELNQEITFYAQYLLKINVKPKTTIPIVLSRDEKDIIAMLAIMRVGCAFVPIDANTPLSRLQNIIEQLNSKIIFDNTGQETIGIKSEEKNIKVVQIRSDKNTEIDKISDLDYICDSHDMAYIIFTSGTTGTPKGVVIEHSSVMNYYEGIVQEYQLSHNDKHLLVSDPSFDLGYTSLFGALLSGATLYIPSVNQILSPTELVDLIKLEQITVIKTTPLYFNTLLQVSLENNSNLVDHDILIILGGEKLTSTLLTKISAADIGRNITLYNHYGPTEATIGCLTKRVDFRNESVRMNYSDNSCLGLPFKNTKVYVLDEFLHPLPIGAVGELYVSGKGLAREYYLNSELTNKSFINNPFELNSNNDYSRLYRTGDLVRCLPNKEIEFIARNDGQIKLRGFRVELDEIKSTLLGHSDIIDVVLQVTDDQKIIAYFVAGDFVPTKRELNDYLEAKLPLYMIPSYFIQIDKIPLTTHGKIDKFKLPPIVVSRKHSIVLPKTDIQRQYCQIWESIFQHNQGSIGITDDFFELGGDSILAIRLISKINKTLNLSLRVKDIFECKTIEKLSTLHKPLQLGTSQYFKKSLLEDYSLLNIGYEMSEIEDYFPASYLQKGMLYESELTYGNTYNNILAYRVKSVFDEEKFLAIWNDFANLHELLRASFHLDNKHGWVVLVHKSITLKYTIYNNKNIEKLISQQKEMRFNYSNPGLFKLVVNKGEEYFDVIINFHHSIQDGWSMASLLNDFLQAYIYHRPIRYKHFLHYGEFIQNELNVLSDKNKMLFWENYLKNTLINKLNWGKNTNTSGAQISVTFELSKKLSAQILAISKNNKLPSDIIFLLAYMKTISFLTNSKEIVVGIGFNNRLEKSGGDEMIGLFLNILPIKCIIDKNFDFNALLEEKLRIFQLKEVPYGAIKTKLKKDLYYFAFNFVNFHVFKDEHKLIQYIGGHEQTSIPFLLNVAQENEQHFVVEMVSNEKIIDVDGINAFQSYFLQILEGVVQDRNYVPQILPQEYEIITQHINNDLSLNSKARHFLELFDNQVKNYPDNLAFTNGIEQFTYQELDNKAEQLAAHLSEQFDISEGDIIALLLERQENYILWIIAIFKVNATFLSIDPGYPKQRVEEIINISTPKLIITSQNVELKYKEILQSQRTIHFDHKVKNSVSKIAQKYFSNSIAYIIFTSGTTGKPKGVKISHSSLVNYIENIAANFSMPVGTRVDFSTNPAFDLSITTSIVPLCLGWNVCVYKGKLNDINTYIDHLKMNQIQILKLPTRYFELIAENLIDNTSISKIIVGGEKLNRKVLEKFSALEKKGLNPVKFEVYDEYGPTETTIGATLAKVFPSEYVDIGKPYKGYYVVICNELQQILPIGVIGEMYIGGRGISSGYFNDDLLSSKKFINLRCLNKLTQQKFYKTGDLACWSRKGTLEYIGRYDNQVKINGYRVELEEIQEVLLRMPAVKDAYIKIFTQSEDLPSNKQILAAFYVSASPITDTAFLKHFKNILPEYMVPNKFIFAKQFLLTEHGKIDGEKLVLPKNGNSVNHKVPENKDEILIADIVAELLDMEIGNISIYEKLTAYGADSITRIQLLSRLKEHYLFNITIKDLVDNQSIFEIVKNVINKKRDSDKAKIVSEQDRLTGDVPLLPIQHWFFEQSIRNRNFWNQAFYIVVPNLDLLRLQDCLNALVNYHDAFRLRFRRNAKHITQYYDDRPIKNEITVIDTSDILQTNSDDIDMHINQYLFEIQSKFDLEKGPLHAFVYCYDSRNNKQKLYVIMHHLITDTVSWRIITSDLHKLYFNRSMLKKGTSYRQWVIALAQYETTNHDEKIYWQKIIQESQSIKITIPTQTKETSVVFNLSEEATSNLLIANNTYHTVTEELLLAALSNVLANTFGYKDIYITLESHGREDIGREFDVSRTIGWFTSLYIAKLTGCKNIKDRIIVNKEQIRAIPNNGLAYAFSKKARASLPQISFNFLGRFSQDLNNNNNTWSPTFAENIDTVDSKNESNHVLLHFNGYIKNNILNISVHSRFGQDVTKNIANAYAENLLEIINHTIRENRTYITPSDIDNITSQNMLDKIQLNEEFESIYLANSLQEGFIVHENITSGNNNAYLVQIKWSYNRAINVDLLKQAWKYAQERFAALRLKFTWGNENLQLIKKQGQLKFNFYDIQDKGPISIKDTIDQFLLSDKNNIISLQSDSLFRVNLFQVTRSKFYCIFTYHHAIIDGWGLSNLLDYLHEIYLKLESGLPIEFSRIYTYEKSQKYLQNNKSQSNDYWRNLLEKANNETDLSGLLRPNANSNALKTHRSIAEYSEIFLYLPKSEVHSLNKLLNKHHITAHVALVYFWHKTLSIYGNSDCTIVGMVVSGREIPIDNITKSVGLHINTLPFPIIHSKLKDMDMLKVLTSLQERINQAHHNSNVNLSALSNSQTKLFESIFVLENYPESSKDINNKMCIEEMKIYEKVDYPLTLVAKVANNSVGLKLKYSTDLFVQTDIKQLLNTMMYLIQQFIENPKIKPKAFSLVSDQQYLTIQDFSNKEKEIFQISEMLHTLFEKRVGLNPNHIAIVCQNNRYTYNDLNIMTNKLANYLLNTKAHLICNNKIIGVMLHKDENIIITILAILKLGVAYLPLDPGYPEERLVYLLKDSKIDLLLTSHLIDKSLKLLINTHKLSLTTLTIDDNSIRQQIERSSDKNIKIKIDPDQLAYVIYTSGTTGLPKGVMQSHKSVLSLFKATEKHLDFGENDTWLLFHSFVFDFSIWEIWGALIHGGKLVIPAQDDIRDLKKLISLCDKESITIINQTPSIFYELENVVLSDINLRKIFENVKYIIFGGEALDTLKLKKWLDFYGTERPQLINMYGITETCIHSTFKKITRDDLNYHSNIGRLLADTSGYVLDQQHNLLPPLAIGELYIGGQGLARGYLGNPILTQNSFIHTDNTLVRFDKRISSCETTLYKTGDLVYWRSDGSLIYIGRTDSQVKIHGYRINLAEIEHIISLYPGVLECKVIKLSPNSDVHMLIGFYVSNTVIAEEHIFAFIMQRLPSFSMPNKLMQLSSIPKTINGKLDIAKLELIIKNKRNNNSSECALTEIEQKIAAIWLDTLSLSYMLKDISKHDNFFKLGGNSILAIRVVQKINQQFGVTINLGDLFCFNTLEALRNHIQILMNNGDNKLLHKNDNNQYPLSYAQERFWFLNSFEDYPNIYNVTFAYKIKPNTNLNILKQSFIDVVNRHEILRTCILTNADSAEQIILENSLTFNEFHFDLMDNFFKTLSKELNITFDLSRNLPIRICFYSINNSTYISIVVHHIAFDAWSENVFFEDLNLYYQSYLQQLPVTFDTLPWQYKDYAVYQKQKTGLKDQQKFWQAKLAGYQKLQFNLPNIKVKRNPFASKYAFSIEITSANKIKQLALKYGVTAYSIFLSIYYVLLYAFTSQKDITIGVLASNRNLDETKKIIGCFINTLPQRIYIKNDYKLSEFIQEVANEVALALQNQECPFEKIVEVLGIEKDPINHPIFEVMFGFTSLGEHINSKYILFEEFNLDNLGDRAVLQHDLTLQIDENLDTFTGNFIYNSEIFPESMIKSMHTTFNLLMDQFLNINNGRELLISDLNFTKETIEITNDDYNLDASFLEKHIGIKKVFEQQVHISPQKVALTYLTNKITYTELEKISNQYAHCLNKNYNITQGEQVPLIMEKTDKLIIIILALIKLRACFIPIDQNIPKKRLEYILQKIKPKCILTEDKLVDIISDKMSNQKQHLVSIDNSHFILMKQKMPTSSLPIPENLDDLLYILFTSGTTGIPKGVRVKQAGIINLIIYLIKKYNFTDNESIALTSNYIFDPFIEQMFLALLSGNTLVIIPDALFGQELEYYKYLTENKVTHIEGCPSLLQQYRYVNLPSLKRVISGGEPITKRLCEIYKPSTNIELYNVYGCTETSISTFIQKNDNYSSSIGCIIPNNKAYVANEFLKPLPLYAVGYLYISGVCLADEYLDSVSQNFIDNIFNNELINNIHYQKLFKTGDKVRYRTNKVLDYIGRDDSQVKLHGQRIELGEVENNILKYPGISQVCVTLKMHKNKSIICAYIVASNKIPQRSLNNFLNSILPNYMVPRFFVYVDKIPLTVSGKIDFDALAKIPLPYLADYSAPVTEMEIECIKIWEKTLKLEAGSFGIRDNYFQIGGTSITAISTISELNKTFNAKLRLVDLFLYSTIETLIDKIIQLQGRYKPISLLNKSSKNTKMFMIHPGHSGCEVYSTLARELQDLYLCYGIDSYNLYHDEKLKTIKDLSIYYANLILGKITRDNNKEKITILGWSLGGLISLEIAAILEGKGIRNITLILLDTYIFDDVMLVYETVDKQDRRIQNYISQAKKMGVDSDYVDKVATNMLLENNIIHTKIYCKLKDTRCILFKAMSYDSSVEYTSEDKKLLNYLTTLSDNNVSNCFYNKKQFKVVNLQDATHETILEFSLHIKHELLKFGSPIKKN